MVLMFVERRRENTPSFFFVFFFCLFLYSISVSRVTQTYSANGRHRYRRNTLNTK